MKRILLYTIIMAVAAGANAQSLTLHECRQLALTHNEQMQTADNAVRQAELDRQIAFTNYLPMLDGQLMSVYNKDTEMMGMKFQMHGAFMAGLTLTQPVYTGGKIMTGNRLAAVARDISETQRRQTRMQLIAAVDNAYYTLIAVEAKVRMLEAYDRQMQGLYDQVAVSVRAQMATENDLLRIATKQNEISYQLQKARNGFQLCQLSLANVIGDYATADIVPADTVLAITAPASLDEGIGNRPELHLLEKAVEIQNLQVRMARADYLPTVALSLGYSYYDNFRLKGTTMGPDGMFYPYSETFNGHSPMAMLSVSVPLFHWGAELKKVKKAQLQADNARLQLQQSERGMRIEVRQAVKNLTDGYRMVETARLGQQQADENLRVMRQRYDAQMSTMTDLLDAQSQWQQARSNLIEAETQYKIYETEYLRVTGRLDADEK